MNISKFYGNNNNTPTPRRTRHDERVCHMEARDKQMREGIDEVGKKGKNLPHYSRFRR